MLLVGCEKPEAPETVTEFNPEIDGTIPPPAYKGDRNILSGRGSALGAGGEGTGDGEPGADAGDIDGVKQMVASMKMAVATGKMAVLADHYAPAQAGIGKLVTKSIADERAALADAQSEIVRLDASLLEKLTPVAGTYEGPWDLLAGDVELTYSASGGSIHVVNSQDPRKMLVFTKAATGQWVFTYGPWEAADVAQGLPDLGRLAAARAEVFTAISEGLRQATINATNFNEKLDALVSSKITPLLSPPPPSPPPPGTTPPEPTPPEPTPPGPVLPVPALPVPALPTPPEPTLPGPAGTVAL